MQMNAEESRDEWNGASVLMRGALYNLIVLGPKGDRRKAKVISKK
jgi:hypothetical protein